jgi:hypothetical protein
MPVALPPEKSIEDRPNPPNVIVWLVLLLVFMVAGVTITLLTWPKGESTNTVEFWLRLLGVPPLAWTIALGFRLLYRDQEDDRLDAEEEVLRENREQALEFASEPLAVTALAYLSAAGNKDVATDIVKLKSVVEAQDSLDGQAAIRHSALELISSDTNPCRYRVAFKRLIASIKQAVEALPLDVPFGVRLQLPAGEDQETLQQTWQTCWDEAITRPAYSVLVTPEQGAMALDEWLDEQGGQTLEKFLLFVAVQLHDAPPPNSGEAAVALLIGWPPLASRRRIECIGSLHRPVQAADTDINVPLSTALEWGRTEHDAVNDLWQTGLDKSDKAAVLNSSSTLELGMSKAEDLSGLHDLDIALGRTGCASAWLALALSLEHAVQTRRPQLVAWRNGSLHFSIVQPVA